MNERLRNDVNQQTKKTFVQEKTKSFFKCSKKYAKMIYLIAIEMIV
jgi:hypothetical protein